MSDTGQGPEGFVQAAAFPATSNLAGNSPPIHHVAVTPTDFSTPAAKEYDKISTEYLVALEQASRAIAKSKKADSVSASHVQLAAESLGNDHSQKFRRMGELGTLLIGAGLGYLGNVMVGSSYTFRNALITFIPLLIGCALYFFSMGHD